MNKNIAEKLFKGLECAASEEQLDWDDEFKNWLIDLIEHYPELKEDHDWWLKCE